MRYAMHNGQPNEAHQATGHHHGPAEPAQNFEWSHHEPQHHFKKEGPVKSPRRRV
jgi:hypothetical protein